jgi:hypothetical protein
MRPSYNTKYNRDLVKLLNQDMPNMGQTVNVLPEHTSRKYVQPTTSGNNLVVRQGDGWKDVAKGVASVGLDLIAPATGLAVGSLTGNPVAGLAASSGVNLVRNIIKHKTGYGQQGRCINRKGKGIDKKKLAANAKSVGKVVASSLLDSVPSALGLATAAFGDPKYAVPVAAVAKLGREAIRAKTGLGKGKRGKGLSQTAKNIAKQALPVILDSAPYAAGLLAGVSTLSPENAIVARGAVNAIRRGIKHKYGYGIKGKAIKKVMDNVDDNNKAIVNKIIKHLNKKYTKRKLVGGFIDIDISGLTNQLRPLISQALDQAIPAICEYIASYYGNNREVGRAIGQQLRALIKERTGLGFDQDLPKPRPRPRPNPKEQIPSDLIESLRETRPQPRKRGNGAKKLNPTLQRRNALVKQVMEQQNLSWINASKYVSKNKLKY